MFAFKFGSGKKRKIAVLILALCLVLSCISFAFASGATDEILNYEITADVNEDATVSLVYHIDWKVLDDSIGALEWVSIGIPNSSCEGVNAISDNIREIYQDGNYINVYFTGKYYENDVVSFDFYCVMDNMYQMNAINDGYTTYYFTPGWFDEIVVDNLVIRWNNENASSWSANCLIEDGYNTWTASLGEGVKYSINVSYPNDAYAFTKTSSSDSYTQSSSSGSDVIGTIIGALFGLIGMIFPVAFIVLFIVLVRKSAKKNYESGSGFANGQTKTKVTRTKVVYYDTCPGCGAPRGEGRTECEYCGRSLIKSEEVIEEKEVKDEDKEALKYNKNGEYHYSSDPNTFVRVNVVHIPVASPVIFPRSNSHIGGGPRPPMGGGGGCAHSSCACVSCACACACACAGGGRAGCSTKNFYSTKLKLAKLKRK